MPNPDPELSIIIISYRRRSELVLCLEDLCAQRTARQFDVLLVLQAYSRAEIDELRTRFSDRLPLIVLEFEQGIGVFGARNAGLERASGRVLAFVDDDCRVPANWVEDLCAAYDRSSYGGIGGYVRHPARASAARRVFYRLFGIQSSRYRVDWGGFHSGCEAHSRALPPQRADWLSGCNMSFRRDVVERVGHFDPVYGSYGFDDADYSVRVRKAGWELATLPELTVDHFPSTTNRLRLGELLSQEEVRRVIFARRAIGSRRLWKARYVCRFSLYLLALTLVGIAKRDVSLPVAAYRGMRNGLAALRGVEVVS